MLDTTKMRALFAATTQERWAYTQGQVPRVNSGGVSICGIHKIGRMAGRDNPALVNANGEFIAAAHAFVPSACDEIDRLRALVDSTPKVWECFCDVGYYHQWAVRPVGDKAFNSQQLFHVPSEAEAVALRDLLNQKEKAHA